MLKCVHVCIEIRHSLASSLQLHIQVIKMRGNIRKEGHVAEKICIPEFTAVSTCITSNTVLQEHWDFSAQRKKPLQALPAAHPSDLSVHL